MKFKRLTAGLLSAVMAFGLAACSSNNGASEANGTNNANEVSNTQEAGQEPVHLNLAESWGFEYFYTVITPEVTSSGYDLTYWLPSFYDTLVEYDSNGELSGVLAESWSMSEDGCTYTFKIRQGIQFSDGSDLTAEDVAKSLLAVPVNLGQYNGGYGKLSTIIKDAIAVDEYTVELQLEQPYYGTMRELCLANPWGIVSSEQLNEDLTAKDTFKSATCGTGPYMYSGDNNGQVFNFEYNTNYWGEKPDVDSFSVKNIPDNDAKLLALKNGEIDFYTGITKISAENFEEMSATDGFSAKADENALQTYYIGYNLSDPIFGDQVVREAIATAVDKDAITQNIFGGLYEAADTFFSRSLPYCDVDQKVYEYNMEAANKLLNDAGYVDTDNDGIREKDGVKLSAEFVYQTGSASDDDTVVYICDQLKQIGIELTPSSAAMMDWFAMVSGGQYGVTIFKTQGGYYDPTVVVGGLDPKTSTDPILSQVNAYLPDGSLDELNAATEEEKIQEIYNTILTTMSDKCLVTPLYYTHQLSVYNSNVSDYEYSGDTSFTSVQNIKVK